MASQFIIATEVILQQNVCFDEQKCIFEHCRKVQTKYKFIPAPGNIYGGSITVLLTSCLTGLD
jgi:hypothetical protein